jgi:O-antigen/teichoic acid export membrane protein
MSGTASPLARPGVVTLVGIVVYLWAALAAIEAIALFFNRNDDAWLLVYGKDEIVIMALIQAVIAVALFAVGYGVMTGAKWARLALAIIVGLRLAALTWFMLITLGNGAFTWSALIGVAIGVFVLWALYGDDKSIAYYEGVAA